MKPLDEVDSCFSKQMLWGLLKRRDYCALERVLPFVASLISQSIKNWRSASLAEVRIQSNDIVCDVVGGEE